MNSIDESNMNFNLNLMVIVMHNEKTLKFHIKGAK